MDADIAHRPAGGVEASKRVIRLSRLRRRHHYPPRCWSALAQTASVISITITRHEIRWGKGPCSSAILAQRGLMGE
jgi:hypothetical protein